MALHIAKEVIKDGPWRLFAWEPALKRTVWVAFDGPVMHVKVDYDVTQLLEENKDRYNNSENKWAGEGMHHVARVPIGLFYDKLEGKMPDQKFIKKWLNDPDNRYFRTKRGHL